MPINFRSDARVFICGKTGSGKTFLAERLCRGVKRLIVLDPKGTLAGWGLEEWGSEARARLLSGEEVRARVVAPGLSDQTDSIWEEVMIDVYTAGQCTLYIDEVYAVIPPGRRASPAMVGIWTRGREYQIGAWASSQRPSWCPLFVMSEAEHYFMFRLTLDEDRKRVAGFIGREVENPITDTHGFFYAAASSDKPQYIEHLEA